MELAATKFVKSYPNDVNDDLVQEIRSFKEEFHEDLCKMETVRDVLQHLIKIKLLASMPELATACVLFVTLPVTVASCERSFSKLKIIKTYLRSTIAQDRLSGLAILAIENKEATFLDKEKVIGDFANKKSRLNKFT
jgi:hypothetical protein